jgi:hypothetical protein
VRYGVEEHIGSVKVRQKIKDSFLDRYGVVNPGQIPEVHSRAVETQASKPVELKAEEQAKQTQTLLDRYGAENPMHIQAFKEKRAQTCVTRFGVSVPAKNSEVLTMMQTTCLARHGVSNPFESELFKEKAKRTMLEKYGVEHTMQSPDSVIKMMETKLTKYGSLMPQGFGKAEQQVRTWVEAITNEAFPPNHRLLAGKEVDMYSEELKLGVEYCGLFWHTEDSPTPRTRNYHKDKQTALAKQGVRLITIFEDEWLTREAQVKNFLRSALGKNDHTVYARKCSVQEITKKQAAAFLDAHHIQGSNTLAKTCAGLFHEETLLAVMTFGTHHRGGAVVVLDRFAVAANHNIPGGASKLFKFLLRLTNTAKVISWSDNRWSVGNVYEKLGFTKESTLPPDYSYVDFKNPSKRISKQSQRKSAVDCPEDLTEKEFAVSKDLHRIWDCGKVRWVYVK